MFSITQLPQKRELQKKKKKKEKKKKRNEQHQINKVQCVV